MAVGEVVAAGVAPTLWVEVAPERTAWTRTAPLLLIDPAWKESSTTTATTTAMAPAATYSMSGGLRRLPLRPGATAGGDAHRMRPTCQAYDRVLPDREATSGLRGENLRRGNGVNRASGNLKKIYRRPDTGVARVPPAPLRFPRQCTRRSRFQR